MTKKAFALRLDPAVHAAIERLAASDSRSNISICALALRNSLAASR